MSAPREPLMPPPRFLSRWSTWAILLVVLLVPFFVPIPIGLRKHPVIGPLGDQLHIPLLGAIMLAVYWKGPLRGRLWGSALAATVVGGLIEFFQLFVGRGASLGDWGTDMVGIGIVLGFVLWRGRGSRSGLALLCALLLSIPWTLRGIPAEIRAQKVVVAAFPVLDGFDDPHTRILWDETNDNEVSFVRIDDGPAGPAAVLQFTGGPDDTWPGAGMFHFPYDWRGYDRLMVRVRHTGPDSLLARFRISVVDFAGSTGDVRFTQSYLASSKWQDFAMPLAGRVSDDGGHVIDLGDVEKLFIFLTKPQRETTLQVDEVWLD